MSPTFFIISILVLGSAIAAMTLRNLIHCALCLAITFLGLAAFYLQLDAQFVGFAQVLVYVGAVAILIVFAILLTREAEQESRLFSSAWLAGIGIALAGFAVIASIILSSKVLGRTTVPAASVTVRDIGIQLMTTYVLPLQVIGLLLTVALIGAVIIALKENRPRTSPTERGQA